MTASTSEPELPFPPFEYERRLAAVRRVMSQRGIDVLLVNKPENICYLSGYETLGYFSFQLLIVSLADPPKLVVRYGERSNVWSRSWVQDYVTWTDEEDPTHVTLAAVGRHRGVVASEYDSWFVTPRLHESLKAGLGDLQDGSQVVESCRLVKSGLEIECMEHAAQLSLTGLHAGLHAVRPGCSDLDIAAAVLSALAAGGSEYPPLPPLLALGRNSARFHSTWCGTTSNPGDCAFLEVPGVVRRYLAAVASTAALEPVPQRVRAIWNVLVESLEAGVAAIRPGATCAEVYEAMAEPVTRAGYEVPINTGYPVGIAFPPRWVESPLLRLLPGNRMPLEAGMCLHLPRTIRVRGEQTPIISETVLVTERGARALIKAPRMLHIVG